MDYDITFTKFSLQRALLGEIGASFRGIAFVQENREILLFFFLDGPISEEDKESFSIIETYMLADFPPEYIIRSVPVRLDYPELLDTNKGNWVYLRRES